MSHKNNSFATDDVVPSWCNLTAELGGWSGLGLSTSQRHGEGRNDEVSRKRDALTFTCNCFNAVTVEKVDPIYRTSQML